MPENRRKFLRRSGILVGGAAALGSLSPAYAGKISAPLRSATSNSSVADLLRRAGVKSSWLRGGSVLGALRNPVCTNVIALAANPVVVFSRVLTGMSFEKPYAAGNSLTFADGEHFYRLEVLTKQAFAALRTQLAAGQGIRFAHEAMLKSMQEGTVADPFGVLGDGGRRLRLVGTPEDSVAGKIATVLDGCLHSFLYGLPLSAEFKALQAGVLDELPASGEEAAAIANEFTAAVSLLSKHAGGDLIERLAGSPLIGTSLEKTFGRSVQQVRETAAALPVTALSAPGAPWLAGILGPDRIAAKQGAVWIEDSDRFSFLQSKAALADARLLTTSTN